jgi:hypothetical protein
VVGRCATFHKLGYSAWKLSVKMGGVGNTIFPGKKQYYMNEKMSAATNSLNWFEIPVVDISRAKIFYESIFEIIMDEIEMPGMKYAMFQFDRANGKVGGALLRVQWTNRAQLALWYI